MFGSMVVIACGVNIFQYRVAHGVVILATEENFDELQGNDSMIMGPSTKARSFFNIKLQQTTD